MNFAQFFFVEQWPWWLGGIVIGLLVPLLYWCLNTALGVSTGYGNLAKILHPKTNLKWLNSNTFEDRFGWRVFFIAGMILGAFLSARGAGLSLFTGEMGIFTQVVQWPAAAHVIWFFVGGALLGFGARVAGGCTSGHSIHGLANFHLSSLIATVFFLLFGAITVFFIRIFLTGVA